MSARRIGPQELRAFRRRLDDRALAIVRQVAELRLMSGGQIMDIHFPVGVHRSAIGASRAAWRTLVQLTDMQLLSRSGRQLGGIRGGSTGYIYALGSVGKRLLEDDGRRYRFHEPSLAFVDHTLAVSQLAVDLIKASRDAEFELLELEAEPSCWRTWSGLAGRQVLRPDLFVAIGKDDYEHRYFIEMDRASTHIPAVLRKCQIYQAYYQSGSEQAAHGVYPRVVWVVPDQARADRLGHAIAKANSLLGRMFIISTTDEASKRLTEGIE